MKLKNMKKINRDNMIYYSSKEPCNFKTFKTIRSFGENIYSSKITMNEADKEQADLIEYILNLIIKLDQKIGMIKKTKQMFLILQTIFVMVAN